MSAPLPTSELAERVAGHSFAPVTCSASGRTHLDLFSGIGGFALAAKWAGWKTIGFAETDTYASNILKRHWPDVPNYGDVRNVRNVKATLITGGFPCQPYSVAGKQAGNTDDRALWPEMLRIIQETRPDWVLSENVPGIVTMALDGVLADLERAGYACEALCVPACGVDARHRRERVWIVAHSERAGQQDGWAEGAASVAGCGKGGEATKDIGAAIEESSRFHGGKGWAAEPPVGRVAHGIPNRVDRLRGLGNAIVPQVATVILAAMARMQNGPS